MKVTTLPLFLVCCLLGFNGFASGAIVIGFTNTLGVANFSQSVMNQVGTLRWFFAHASVGGNILSGIESLHATNPTFYPIDRSFATDTPPATTQSGIICDYDRGNPWWQEKVDGFTNSVNNGWHFPKVDIAMNKFCWIDPTADVNYYINSMVTLETNHPSTWFIYATIPLTPDEDSENYQRSLFNDFLRAWCRTNNRILYDIADMEAHDPNGVEQTFTYLSHTCQKQFSGYTSDGGHLTTTAAQQMAARGFYALGAALLARANPASDLRLQINVAASGGCQIGFTANSNVIYTLEYNSTLSSNTWHTLTNIASEPFERNLLVEDSVSPTNSSRFYRVADQRAP